MITRRAEELQIADQLDIVRVRRAVREWMVADAFSLVDQTKMVTAASELARNALDFGGGGVVLLEQVLDGPRAGVRLTFTDHGAGIPDLELALTDGYTSGHGLGLGLGGSRRLVNEFAIESSPGKGTIVTVARWR